jgi:hypothetical protein
MSKIRKMFAHPLYVIITILKYGIFGALLKAELELFFELFKPLFMMNKIGPLLPSMMLQQIVLVSV